MKICVFGAGAVGGHFAAKLAARGHEVSVVARGAHLQAMQAKGITLVHGNDTIHGRVRAVDRAAALGVQDFVFVTLKANLLGAFAEQAAPLLGPGTGVVFAQNGIPWWYAIGLAPNRPKPPALAGAGLEKLVDKSQLIGGVVYSANEVREPGVIVNNVPGNNMLVVGQVDDSDSPSIKGLRNALNEADLYSPPTGDIRQVVWAKLVQNLSTAALCTLTGGTVKEVRGDPGLAEVSKSLAHEAKLITRAHGVDAEKAPARPSGGQSAGAIAHKPSLLQDYERGRPMEIDALLTAPVGFARAAGVPAPTLEAIAALVVFKARGKGLYSRAAD